MFFFIIPIDVNRNAFVKNAIFIAIFAEFNINLSIIGTIQFLVWIIVNK